MKAIPTAVPVKSPDDGEDLAQTLRSKKLKKRGVVATVVIMTLALHVIAGIIAAAMIIVNDFIEEAEDFEEPPVIAAPQKRPEYQVNIQKLKKQSSPPRPRPIVVHNPNNINLPALDVPKIDSNIAITGRGTGGFGVGVGSSGPPKFDVNLIFGMELQGKLGVILDVSKSAHDELPFVYKELSKFPDAIIIFASGCGMKQNIQATIIPGRNYMRDIDKYHYKGDKGTQYQLATFMKTLLNKYGLKDSSSPLGKLWGPASRQQRIFAANVNLNKHPKGSANFGLSSSFEYLMKQECTAIYWFADFQDKLDMKVVEPLARRLAAKKIKVYQHDFDGKKAAEEMRYLSKRTKGKFIHAPPSELIEEEKKKANEKKKKRSNR